MNVTDLEYAALLAVALLLVFGVDMVVAKRAERRWAERRRVRAELRRHEEQRL